MSAAGARKTSLSVTTEHTLTVENLTRHRNAYLWIVAVFDQARPEAIYEITPLALETYFSACEKRLAEMQANSRPGSAPVHLNNPRIPFSFIEENGVRVWPSDGPAPAQRLSGF